MEPTDIGTYGNGQIGRGGGGNLDRSEEDEESVYSRGWIKLGVKLCLHIQ